MQCFFENTAIKIKQESIAVVILFCMSLVMFIDYSLMILKRLPSNIDNCN